MTAALNSTLVSALEAAAAQAGLVLVSATQGSDFHGRPTAVFQLGLAGAQLGLPQLGQSGAEAAGRTLKLELSEPFDFDKPDLLPAMTAYVAAEAKRLRNPRPDCYVTLAGLPVAFGQFQWPFHLSTSSTGKCTWPTAGRTTFTPRSPPRSPSPLPRSCPPWSSPMLRVLFITPSARPWTWASLNS